MSRTADLATVRSPAANPDPRQNALTIETQPSWLRVAHIVRPQGHRGAVVADLLTDFPERFDEHPQVDLRAPGAIAPQRTMNVASWREHLGRIVLTFRECTSMNEAEALRDYDVVIAWEDRKPLAEDELYIAELDGCTFIDATSGATIGTVVDVDQESSNNALLVVLVPGRGELLVPFVKAYAPQWDLAARTLRMQLPEGLLDLLEPAKASE